jgi:formylglycine-generating enzyme required for sulfatase activity
VPETDAHIATPAEPEADLAGSGAHLQALGAQVRDLVGRSLDQLVELVEAPDATLATRHAAGLLLALAGDPRLVVDQPAMIDVPAADVPIGLPADRLDAVVAEWAPLGVLTPWIAKEVPRHTVHVGAFRIGRYPVTNGEYLAFVLDDPTAERPSCWAHGVFPVGASNQPVYSLSPDGADAYAAWLSRRTGRTFRLPTEAEWEYAATGGDGRQYPWGESWDPTRANTAELGPLTTTPVGIHVEGDSPFGVADLAGNVEEYVADAYRPYPGAEVVHDDLIDVHGDVYRVARGGSYARHGDLARCARRHGWYPSDHFAMGFRLAETI